MTRRNWSREETLVAFALYCRLPFGRLHGRNPEIVSVAQKLGRTASAVAMKCCNLASLDESHQARGIRALSNVSAQDRTVWDEYLANPDSVSFEAARALATIESRPLLPLEDVEHFGEGRESERVVRVRVNQRFFREMILAGYTEKCAVCGLALPALLVASHIVPWSVDPVHRLHPRNGLCLCGTHDRAYECGILRVHPNYRIRISVAGELREESATANWLVRFEGERIRLPQRWSPDPVLLQRKLDLLSAAGSI